MQTDHIPNFVESEKSFYSYAKMNINQNGPEYGWIGL